MKSNVKNSIFTKYTSFIWRTTKGCLSMEIKDLTLYGRMVYGLHCFVRYWNMLDTEENRDEIKFILGKLCTFTNSEYLDEWQDDTLPLTPACIFEAINESGNSLCRPERCPHYNFRYEICEFAKECDLVKNKKESKRQIVTTCNNLAF